MCARVALLLFGCLCWWVVGYVLFVGKSCMVMFGLVWLVGKSYMVMAGCVCLMLCMCISAIIAACVMFICRVRHLRVGPLDLRA